MQQGYWNTPCVTAMQGAFQVEASRGTPRKVNNCTACRKIQDEGSQCMVTIFDVPNHCKHQCTERISGKAVHHNTAAGFLRLQAEAQQLVLHARRLRARHVTLGQRHYYGAAGRPCMGECLLRLRSKAAIADVLRTAELQPSSLSSTHSTTTPVEPYKLAHAALPQSIRRVRASPLSVH